MNRILTSIMILMSMTAATHAIDIDLGPLGGVEAGVGPYGVGADVAVGPVEAGAGVGPYGVGAGVGPSYYYGPEEVESDYYYDEE